jgi:hypothetical protein
MLVKLPTVTLFGIDCVEPNRLAAAFRWSMRFVDFARVVLVTEVSKLTTDHAGMEVVDHKEGGRLDYEVDALTLAHGLTDTPHVLHCEWDAMVANPLAWNEEWLKCDYIGAPWPRHYANGWPTCDAHNCVGNGGFSLRSRRLYERCKEAVKGQEDGPGMRVHDAWIGRTLRPWLEREGLVFATPAEAYRFSCENAVYSGQFGIHGTTTFSQNNIKLPKDW